MLHKKDSEDDGKKKNAFIIRVIWICVILGVLFSGSFLIMGFSMWFVVWVVVWISFIVFLWQRRFVQGISHGMIVGVGIALVITSFILFDLSMPTVQEMQEEHDQLIEKAERVVQDNAISNDATDDVVVFIQDVVTSIGEEPGVILSDDDVLWTAKNMSLKPQDAYSTTVSTNSDVVWHDVQQYLVAQGGDHGTIGFIFEDRSPYEQVGYIIEEGKYTGLMCILTRDSTQIMIGCGWGP